MDSIERGECCSLCGNKFTEAHGYAVICKVCYAKSEELSEAIHDIVNPADYYDGHI